MKFFLLMIVAVAFLMSSCVKEVDSGVSSDSSDQLVTTVAQDKVNINAALDEIVTCLGTMKNGAMMNTFLAFTGVSEGEEFNEDFIEAIFSNMETAIDTIDSYNTSEDRFYVEDFAGTWSYNLNNSSWSRNKAITNKIIIQFPSDEFQTSNDAEIVLKGYTDVLYTFDQEDIYLPKTFDFSVSKGGMKLGAVNLINIVYEQEDEFALPIVIEGSVFLNPFTFTLDAKREEGTKFAAAISINDGTGCGYAMSAEVNLTSDDYNNFSDEYFIDLKGAVSHNNLEAKYFVDLAKLIKLSNQNDDLTDDDLNEHINITCSINDSEIGELFIKETFDDLGAEVHMIYKDGTSENTAVYYEPFADDVEALFSDIINAWDEELEL